MINLYFFKVLLSKLKSNQLKLSEIILASTKANSKFAILKSISSIFFLTTNLENLEYKFIFLLFLVAVIVLKIISKFQNFIFLFKLLFTIKIFSGALKFLL